MNSDFLKMKRLFLKQSYIDAWELYADSMEDENACLWDYIILTASNELQAEAFRKEIACRLEKKVIPDRIHYAVIPDPDGRRVGSGGAAFNVLKYLADIEGEGFADKRILVIHSGLSTVYAASFFHLCRDNCRMEECRHSLMSL